MSAADLERGLAGVVGVLVTPFAAGGSLVDDSKLHELTRRVDAGGAHVLTALGNTAEVYQLTEPERRLVLETVADARSGAALLAGLTGPLEEMVAWTQLAQRLGYDGAMVHEPLDPFASSDGLESLYLQLAERSALPLVLYLRTPRLSGAALLRVVQHPSVIGVKYALTDTAEFAHLLAAPEAQACTWLCGAAESMAPAFAALGVHGFTSGLANVRPDLALAYWQAAANGSREVRRLFAAILPFELLRVRDRGRFNVSVIKWALAWHGLDVGGVRPPCRDADDAVKRALGLLLEDWPPEPAVTVS